MQSIVRFVGLMFALSILSAGARAETTLCTAITTLPHTISTPGIYCLTGSLSTAMAAGTAITINADDVVLDLNGHTLDGSSVGAGTNTWGIRASNRKNITIRNGTLRGFLTAVFVGGTGPGPQGHVIEQLRVDGSTAIGLNVQGQGSVVRNNQVLRTGGSTVTLQANAIVVFGRGVQVTGNQVVETVEGAGSTGIGIMVDSSPGAVVEGNTVSNAAFGPTSSVGIFVLGTSDKVTVVGNRVAHMRRGIQYGGGASGLYMNNTVSGATTPYTGGTAAGATNFSL